MKNKKFITILFLTLIISFSLNSGIVLNKTYPPPPPDPDPNPGGSIFKWATVGSEEINKLLIDGATKFLDSYSDAIILLREYEISCKSSFDLPLALIKTNSALKKLEESRSFYANALSIADQLEYSVEYRNMLIVFDYDTYIIEQDLNKTIAEEVKELMKAGDMNAVYRRNLEKVDEIIFQLKTALARLNENLKPDIKVLWTILQKYSDTALFGNYATVFAEKVFEGN